MLRTQQIVKQTVTVRQHFELLSRLGHVITLSYSYHTPTLSVGVMAEKKAVKYFPVDVDLDKLFDWSQTEVKEGKNGVKVRVNDKDIAVFKYGDGIIAADGE